MNYKDEIKNAARSLGAIVAKYEKAGNKVGALIVVTVANKDDDKRPWRSVTIGGNGEMIALGLGCAMERNERLDEVLGVAVDAYRTVNKNNNKK
jgi:hypothetical protein